MLKSSLLLALIACCDAFVSIKAPRPSFFLQAVKDVGNEADFDGIVKGTSSLVVVDYSTTWCGPCKVIAPKFDELSDKYPNAVFLKVIGDASPEASKLMKREGVRSVPSFHYFVNGEKVDVVNGANADAIEAAITKHMVMSA
jgi:thioredoxin 1